MENTENHVQPTSPLFQEDAKTSSAQERTPPYYLLQANNTKDQDLEDTLEKWNFSLGTPVNTCPQLSGDTEPKNMPVEEVFFPSALKYILKITSETF